jgi:hypothetical protein
VETWLARAVRECGRPAEVVREAIRATPPPLGFRLGRRKGAEGNRVRFWHRPGFVSYGEFVDVDVFPNGPGGCSVLVTASPIVPVNLFALGACERDVSAVMDEIGGLGIPAGPVRVLSWGDPVPRPSDGGTVVSS